MKLNLSIHTGHYINRPLFILLLLFVSLLLESPAAFSKESKHEMHDHKAHEAAMQTEAAKELLKSIGVEEKAGKRTSLETVFTDETGQKVKLSEIIDKPTVVLPVFYFCPVTCPMLLSNLAGALREVPFNAGVDYRVIALSFDEDDTAEIAKDSKAGYMNLLPKTFPESAWTFLTGDKEAIKAFTDGIGYRFKRTGDNNFVHPNAMVMIAEDGKIIRYFYGPGFLGGDIGMAITEAQKGTPGISIKRILSYCLNYDSEGRKVVVTFLKICAALTIGGLALFFIFFLRKGNREQD